MSIKYRVVEVELVNGSISYEVQIEQWHYHTPSWICFYKNSCMQAALEWMNDRKGRDVLYERVVG